MNEILIGVTACIVAAFAAAMIWECVQDYRRFKAWQLKFEADLAAIRAERTKLIIDLFKEDTK